MTQTAAQIFERFELQARDHIAQSKERTDGEAEASHDSLAALHQASAWWDRQDDDTLDAGQLRLLERGLDPRDPYPAGGGDNPVMASSYWEATRWLTQVAGELLAAS